MVSPLHLRKSGPQIFPVPPVNESIEGIHAERPTNEKLNAAGVAYNVRLVLLRYPDLPGLGTYGTRKHPLAIQNPHSRNPFSSLGAYIAPPTFEFIVTLVFSLTWKAGLAAQESEILLPHNSVPFAGNFP